MMKQLLMFVVLIALPFAIAVSYGILMFYNHCTDPDFEEAGKKSVTIKCERKTEDGKDDSYEIETKPYIPLISVALGLILAYVISVKLFC